MAREQAVLSQREIDALLDATGEHAAAMAPAAPGRQPAKAVKIYDFRRPDKFSKDHMRTLQAMHQTLARLASVALSSQLRSAAEVRVSSIEQGLYEEYLQQVPSPSILNIVGMRPLDGNIVIGYSNEIGAIIVDRLLGGPGTPPRGAHDITDIELALFRRAATPLLAALSESWENLLQIQPAVQDVALSPQFLHVARAGDVVIIVLFEVRIGETLGGMSMCLPFATLDPVMAHLNAQSWFSTPGRKQASEADREDLKLNLMRTPIDLSVRLGTADLTAEDLLELKAGDVIRLDRAAGQELEIHVVGKRLLRGRAGLAGRKLAVRITEILGEHERSVDDAGAARRF